ncbi:MAG TPA: DUF1840 domain-containing protein [Rhodocyclaceae bacterium]|nr:DUF1840 domain-containing protein [Rhodocyclaceae bacterium]
MLVKFQSSTSGEIMMFAETARTLLGVLKKECTSRGVITLEQLPDEIALLRAAVERDHSAGNTTDESDSGDELPVGFSQRAAPFLELLQRTLQREGYVMWEAPGEFAGN